MKALILAAGYGTRFSRDLESCQDKYPHLVGVPKPLLPVAGYPLISHWIHILAACSEVSGIYIVVSIHIGCDPELLGGERNLLAKLNIRVL